MKRMDFIQKHKRVMTAALMLCLGLSVVVLTDANDREKSIQAEMDRVAAVELAKKEMVREAHIQQMISEDPETRMEKMTRVTAAIPGEERKTLMMESPLLEPEEVVPEEEIAEEVTYEEETAAEEASETTKKSKKKAEEAQPEENGEYYSSSDLRFMGEIYSGGFRYTWYSQNVLPGGGLDIPGRHVDENGYVCDENDRICLASVDYGYGTVVSTPFGKEGCVYDSGCDSGTLDVYVDF